MLLYHGTHSGNLPGIRDQGLLPRGIDGPTNWAHTIESNPNTVYLTKPYALFFAMWSKSNADDADSTVPVVLEIETDLIDPDDGMLVPDEDALEQGTRGMSRDDPNVPADFPFPPPDQDGDMYARTRFYREIAPKIADFWPGSLDTLGTVGVYGNVPPEAITRVAVLEDISPIELTARDVQITPMNNRFCGAHYTNLVRAVFGDWWAIENDPMAWVMAASPDQYPSNWDEADPAVPYRAMLADTKVSVLGLSTAADRFAADLTLAQRLTR